MSNQKCGTCSELARVIARQQAEITKLKQQLQHAAAACDGIIIKSTQVMRAHGSPYKYNLAKGASEAAQEIQKRLKG